MNLIGSCFLSGNEASILQRGQNYRTAGLASLAGRNEIGEAIRANRTRRLALAFRSTAEAMVTSTPVNLGLGRAPYRLVTTVIGACKSMGHDKTFPI